MLSVDNQRLDMEEGTITSPIACVYRWRNLPKEVLQSAGRVSVVGENVHVWTNTSQHFDYGGVQFKPHRGVV